MKEIYNKICPYCGSGYRENKGKKYPKTDTNLRRWKCKDCGKNYSDGIDYKTEYTQQKQQTESNNRKHGDEQETQAVGSIVTSIKPGTLEDAAKLFKVDLDIGEPKRMIINSGDVSMKKIEQDIEYFVDESGNQRKEGHSKIYPGGITKTNYQVKVGFEKKGDKISPKELAELFREEIKNYTPPKIDYKIPKHENGDLLEVCIFDAHLGKLCWHRETGENYDITIARRRFLNVAQDIINKTSQYKFEKVILPVGNDFFNADTPDDTTTGGTKVDSDVRWQKRSKMGNALLVDFINMYLQVANSVDVVCIPGNHDNLYMYMAGEYLDAWFRDVKEVQVFNQPTLRKYYKGNDVLIGYTHGGKEKPNDLFAIMAKEQAFNWSETTFKEWHLGHYHKQMVNDYKGMIIRWMKSITGTDEGHYKKGFIGSMKGADAFVWRKNEGLVAQINSYIK